MVTLFISFIFITLKNNQEYEYLVTKYRVNKILYNCINNIYLGFTALHIAALKGHLHILQYMISEGSSLQERNNQGKNNIILILI